VLEPRGEILERLRSEVRGARPKGRSAVDELIAERRAEARREAAGKRESVEALGISVEAFSAEDAETVAELWQPTRRAGLSLADRACLALARRLGVAAHTADRDWRKVAVGVEVVLIRSDAQHSVHTAIRHRLSPCTG
jgi:PIN domain nuclease of toxin-antitoxin system